MLNGLDIITDLVAERVGAPRRARVCARSQHAFDDARHVLVLVRGASAALLPA